VIGFDWSAALLGFLAGVAFCAAATLVFNRPRRGLELPPFGRRNPGGDS
jgi:hypothetical protein